jgi:predicted lipoprotein with Yx(FWY)xxD motif
VRNPVIVVCALAAAALAAGCGSSSTTTSTTATAASQPAVTATQAASAATGSSGTPNAGSATGTTIGVKHSKFGTILAAGPNHMTVYLFEADNGGHSTCSGECAAAWPPVTTGGRPQTSGSASASHLGTITRSDGTRQVTYNGHPLYFFAEDKDGGDAYGQGSKAFGAGWYVMAPSGNKVDDDSHSGGDDDAS